MQLNLLIAMAESIKKPKILIDPPFKEIEIESFTVPLLGD